MRHGVTKNEPIVSPFRYDIRFEKAVTANEGDTSSGINIFYSFDYVEWPISMPGVSLFDIGRFKKQESGGGSSELARVFSSVGHGREVIATVSGNALLGSVCVLD